MDDPIVPNWVRRQKVNRDVMRGRAFGGEPAGCIRVQAGALAWREICLDRRPNDRMHETQRPTLLEDPRGGEVVRRGCSGARIDLGTCGSQPKVRFAPTTS